MLKQEIVHKLQSLVLESPSQEELVGATKIAMLDWDREIIGLPMDVINIGEGGIESAPFLSTSDSILRTNCKLVKSWDDRSIASDMSRIFSQRKAVDLAGKNTRKSM
eukprot:625812-Ditylum_brightwellii.AAC.1